MIRMFFVYWSSVEFRYAPASINATDTTPVLQTETFKVKGINANTLCDNQAGRESFRGNELYCVSPFLSTPEQFLAGEILNLFSILD